jgi:transposase InsO family protein
MQLREDGEVINHKTVEKLMKELGLKARIRKVKYRSYKGDIGRIAPNVLARNFAADKPNKKWLTDVTQVNIKGEKMYLSPTLDTFNGEIIT